MLNINRIFIFVQVNAFNLNMQILNWYGIVFQSGMNMSTRIVLILIEFGYISLLGIFRNAIPDIAIPINIILRSI